MDEDLRRFHDALGRLSAKTIRASASAIRRCQGDETGEDVLWWNATMAIDDALRARGQVVEAAAAARRASECVAAAAEASRLDPSGDADVAVVIHRAKEVARGLVAGGGARDATAWLLSCWSARIHFDLPPDPPKKPELD
jgi:hypothetical protein